MLRLLRPVLLLLGEAIMTETAKRPCRGSTARPQPSPLPPPRVPDSGVHRIAETIADRLRIAITLARPDALAPAEVGESEASWRARLLDPLLANLNPNSAALRHALRTAAAAAVGFALTLAWPTSYGYWLTITLVMTMQPYFAATFTRAAERIGGTVLGGAIGAAIAIACPTPLSMAVALFPLAVLALAVRAVNFGLFMTCVTPVVMLLVELARPGQNQLDIALLRGLYTLGGGAARAAVQRRALADMGAVAAARRDARRDGRARALRLRRDRRPARCRQRRGTWSRPAAPPAWPATTPRPACNARCWSRPAAIPGACGRR